MPPRIPETSRLVVGIGASAGGLEALRTFFRAMPSPCGMAFVVITHLAPDHESFLAEILGQTTSLTVSTATDGVEVEDDHVYVLPPGHGLTIANRRLSLTPLPYDRGDPYPHRPLLPVAGRRPARARRLHRHVRRRRRGLPRAQGCEGRGRPDAGSDARQRDGHRDADQRRGDRDGRPRRRRRGDARAAAPVRRASLFEWRADRRPGRRGLAAPYPRARARAERSRLHRLPERDHRPPGSNAASACTTCPTPTATSRGWSRTPSRSPRWPRTC
jgi:hypothetical protein